MCNTRSLLAFTRKNLQKLHLTPKTARIPKTAFFLPETAKPKLWHNLPNFKVGEVFLEGGAKNVLAALARLGAASLTFSWSAGHHVIPWEAGTNRAGPIDQMIGNLAGPNTGTPVDEPIRGVAATNHTKGKSLWGGPGCPNSEKFDDVKFSEYWSWARDHKDFMLYQVSRKVDIIFWPD